MLTKITDRLVLVNLPDLGERAQRLADGMAVNREKFARDVNDLIKECNHWREKNAQDVAAAEPAGPSQSFDKYR